MTLPKALTTITPFSKYLAMALFILLPFLGFYLGSQFGRATAYLSSPANKTTYANPTATPTPLPTNMAPLQAENYKTSTPAAQQIDTKVNLFFDYPFPNEIKNISENQLVSMRCTHNFLKSSVYGGSTRYTYSDNLGKYTPVAIKNDQPVDSLRYEILQATGVDPEAFMYCLTDQNSYYFFKDSDVAYFAKYNPDSRKIAIFSSIPAVFMKCNPIELTNSGVFYFICKGGDTASHVDLYRINSNTTEIQPFVSCSTDTPGSNPRPPLCTYK